MKFNFIVASIIPIIAFTACCRQESKPAPESISSNSVELRRRVLPLQSVQHYCNSNPIADIHDPAYGRSDYFYCDGGVDITGQSYCLRSGEKNEPRHVRAFSSPNAIINNSDVYKNGSAKFDKPDSITGPLCVEKKLWVKNDRIVFTQPNAASWNLEMQIIHTSSDLKDSIIQLLPNGNSTNPHPQKIYFYRGEDSNYYYYVMLSDDDRGLTVTNNVTNIERYYHIEIYDKNNSTCFDKFSPDKDRRKEGAEAYSFFPWNGPDDQTVDCPRTPTTAIQNTSGGAGHDQP